jgi:hypothetical protein
MRRLAPRLALTALALTLALALPGAPAALPAEGAEQEHEQEKESPAEPALTPARQKELAALIEQLGHEEWEKRDQASRKIEDFGRAALPALREATGSSDQEVVERARVLIEKLDPPPGPGPEVGGPRLIRFGVGGGAVVIARGFAVGGGAQVRSVTGKNGTVTITEGADGITVTVKPVGEDAKPASYSAKDRAEFKKKHKDAYLKYLATDEEKKAAAEAEKEEKKKKEQKEDDKADADPAK